MTSPQSNLFDAHYYATGCGGPYARTEVWFNLFNHIAQRIEQDIAPTTVLDAGCAWGLLVEQLRKRKICADGIDISDYAIGQVHESVKPYCKVGSVATPFSQRYDLIVCMEVLEHMQGAEVEAAIANFASHTDDILFSSTPFDYKEATHFSVYPPEHWAELFARHGFFRDVDFDASFITPWAVRFRRNNDPMLKITRDYERKFWLLHKENQDLRSLTVEMQEAIASHGQHDPNDAADDVANALTQVAQLEDEVTALRSLVSRYENGRFMRFMRWLHKLRNG